MPGALEFGRSAVALEIIAPAEDRFPALDRQLPFICARCADERLLGMKEAELAGGAFPTAAGTHLEIQCRRAIAERVAIDLEDFYEPGRHPT